MDLTKTFLQISTIQCLSEMTEGFRHTINPDLKNPLEDALRMRKRKKAKTILNTIRRKVAESERTKWAEQHCYAFKNFARNAYNGAAWSAVMAVNTVAHLRKEAQQEAIEAKHKAHQRASTLKQSARN
jgi:hypothetical protein